MKTKLIVLIVISIFVTSCMQPTEESVDFTMDEDVLVFYVTHLQKIEESGNYNFSADEMRRWTAYISSNTQNEELCRNDLQSDILIETCIEGLKFGVYERDVLNKNVSDDEIIASMVKTLNSTVICEKYSSSDSAIACMLSLLEGDVVKTKDVFELIEKYPNIPKNLTEDDILKYLDIDIEQNAGSCQECLDLNRGDVPLTCRNSCTQEELRAYTLEKEDVTVFVLESNETNPAILPNTNGDILGYLAVTNDFSICNNNSLCILAGLMLYETSIDCTTLINPLNSACMIAKHLRQRESCFGIGNKLKDACNNVIEGRCDTQELCVELHLLWEENRRENGQT
jgi:hypothetical protein